MRKDIWEAFGRTYNMLVAINFVFNCQGNHKPTFNEIIYLGESKDNWNEGLDTNLTKDLNLSHPFHDLFEHSNFALTDFIYCQNFIFNINCNIDVFLPKKR